MKLNKKQKNNLTIFGIVIAIIFVSILGSNLFSVVVFSPTINGIEAVSLDVNRITGEYKLLFVQDKQSILDQENADIIHISGAIYVDGKIEKAIVTDNSGSSYSLITGKSSKIKPYSNVTFIGKVINGKSEGKSSALMFPLDYDVETNCGGIYQFYPIATYLYPSEQSYFESLISNYNPVGNEEIPNREGVDCNYASGFGWYMVSKEDIISKTGIINPNIEITDESSNINEQQVLVYDKLDDCKIKSILFEEVSPQHYLTLDQCNGNDEGECSISSDCVIKYPLPSKGGWNCENKECVWKEQPNDNLKIWSIIGAIIFISLLIALFIFFKKNRKNY